MKYTVVLLLLVAAACTPKETSREIRKEAPSAASTPSSALRLNSNSSTKKSSKLDSTKDSAKTGERELLKILRWFEQMDAIYRESLWVLRKSKAPVGKSPFGKMQRALLIEMKQKLSNKSLFRCDVYSMKRVVGGLGGVPQSAEVFHRCHSKDAFVSIGEWSHSTPDELTIEFKASNLTEVFGVATAILSPSIRCKLKSNENGIIDVFKCDGLMIDYNREKNQVLRFKSFEYLRSAKNMVRLQAEVLENLDPVRKIDVDVPMEGKIKVVETVLQAPMYEATKVVTPSPSSSSRGNSRTRPETNVPLPIEAQDPHLNQVNQVHQEFTYEQNQQQDQQNQQSPQDGPKKLPRQGHSTPQTSQQIPQHQVPASPEGGEEGFQDGFAPDYEGLDQHPIPAEPPIPAPEIPRELNTK